MVDKDDRNHLFISYAVEDYELAEWLTLRLTNENYMIWCDRFKLLGGESYPKDIDDAIKNKTFRVIALLSHYSINKDNPRKERTLALNIGKQRGTDFLIPLNVDGLSSTELDWMVNDLVYIDFSKSWAQGLSNLLNKLESINTPKTNKDNKKIVTEFVSNTTVTQNTLEKVYTNCFQFERIPDTIKIFQFQTTITRNAIKKLSYDWDIFPKNNKTVFSFHDPSEDIKNNQKPIKIEEIQWIDKNNIMGIPTDNIVKNLLLKSLYMKCSEKNLMKNEGFFYFPKGLLKDDKIHFQGYKKRKTYVKVTGQRKKPGGKNFIYYLSPKFNVEKNNLGEFLLYINIYLHITDNNRDFMPHKQANTCRKYVRKNWWNNHLINRILAIGSYLSDNKDKIIIGNEPKEQILIPSTPITYTSNTSINEEMLSNDS